MNLKPTTRLGLSLFSLAIAAVAILPDRANAATTSLNFNTPVQSTDITNVDGHGPGYSGTVIDYLNVASGIDARVTATVSGDGYTFNGHIPNYTSAGNSSGDAAFDYQIANSATNNGVGFGTMGYTLDFYVSGTNFTTAATPFDFNLLVYDIDGDAAQNESLRVAKGVGSSGLDSYQIGSNGAASLTATENTNDYLFSGHSSNVAETSVNGDVILSFLNTSSVTLQFEANTTSSNDGPNTVFAAIDGDSTQKVVGTFNPVVTAKKLPEPFTIIGTIIGGTAAYRMRKKLKAANQA